MAFLAGREAASYSQFPGSGSSGRGAGPTLRARAIAADTCRLAVRRGGLTGTAFEMDDRFTGYDADAIATAGFEGGKMLLPIDAEDPATVVTLESCTRAVSDVADHKLSDHAAPPSRTQGQR